MLGGGSVGTPPGPREGGGHGSGGKGLELDQVSQLLAGLLLDLCPKGKENA